MKIKRIIGYVIVALIWVFNIYTFYNMGFPFAIYAILACFGFVGLLFLIGWLFKSEGA